MGNIQDLINRYRPGASRPVADIPPTDRNAKAHKPAGSSPPKKITLTVSAGIKIPVADLPPSSTSGFLSGLEKQFTFKNPAYQRALKYHLTPPDEYVYAFCIDNAGNMILPKGCLRRVIDYFQANRIAVDLVDHSIPFKSNKDITATTRLPGDAGRVFAILYAKRFGILIGAGGDEEKSIAAHLIAFRGQRTLVVVKRTWQLYAWQKIIAEHTSLDVSDIGIIGDRHCEPDRPVVVGIDRTLYKHIPDISDRFGFLIIDRCDAANLKIFYKIVWAMQCRYLLGVSEAPRRQDNLTDFMKLFLGDTTARLHSPQRGINHSPPVLRVIKTGFEFFGEKYDTVLSGLCDHADRTKRIVTDILEASAQKAVRVVVVSVRKQQLNDIASGLADNYRQSSLVTGITRPSRLKNICDDFNASRIRIILTTNKTLSALKVDSSADAVFIIAPFKYRGVAAAVVRALRPGGRLVEYLDDHPFFVAALKKRISIYKRLGVKCLVDF